MAENQPVKTKNRVNSSESLTGFAAQVREFIGFAAGNAASRDASAPPVHAEARFGELALELFRLQVAHNAAFRKICEARRTNCAAIKDWREIPAMPTAAFREFELSCLAAAERTAVFHSSGTTGQQPSRHFHNAESLALYEASLLPWFQAHLPQSSSCVCLTPPPETAPHSSLVHMFATVGRTLAANEFAFCGVLARDGSWGLDFQKAIALLADAISQNHPVAMFGTAFNFVHLLDHLAETGRRLQLPAGSRVLETGGYKGRSRTLLKSELHSLIEGCLGVRAEAIICEYGMSELSSQAYATRGIFHFPPWARVQIISPETGREVAEGETGLIRVFDLANVYSVMALQTEDLGIRRGGGFELLGRATLAEPRGCSLMAT